MKVLWSDGVFQGTGPWGARKENPIFDCAHHIGLSFVIAWACALGLTIASARACDGVWNLNPVDGSWNNPANWSDGCVPDGPFDDTHFGASNLTSIVISEGATVFSMAIDAGASAYTFTCPPSQHFTLDTDGIHNDSRVVQRFEIMAADVVDDYTSLALSSKSSAGTAIVITNHGATVGGGANPGFTQFVDLADAGSATLLNNGGQVNGARGGEIDFFNSANANGATITNQAGSVNGALGGQTSFWFASRGANSVITSEGGVVSGAAGGITLFRDTSSAGNATLIANGGLSGGYGGGIQFQDNATGGTPRVKVFGNGNLDIGLRDSGNVTIGSIEGDGQVFLGSRRLSIGVTNVSTTFSGVIQGNGGSLIKLGTGILTLSGASTYTGTTTVTSGAFKVTNRSGSATGSGVVKVNSGILGGNGIISGIVIIGTGNGAGAFLEPGISSSQPAKLTIESLLTIEADGTYTYKLNTKKGKADEVLAGGVTIENGAQFSFNAVANRKLAAGLRFTVISNTSSAPIGGTFANLADGSTFIGGRNGYQVSYSGGDGNDLTLTVQP